MSDLAEVSTFSAIVSTACFHVKLSADAACSVDATDAVVKLPSVASGRLGVELDFRFTSTLDFSYFLLVAGNAIGFDADDEQPTPLSSNGKLSQLTNFKSYLPSAPIRYEFRTPWSHFTSIQPAEKPHGKSRRFSIA